MTKISKCNQSAFTGQSHCQVFCFESATSQVEASLLPKSFDLAAPAGSAALTSHTDKGSDCFN